MPPSDLTIAREWIGSAPDDYTVTEAIGAHGGPLRAALAILRARRADMVANPAQWAVAGDYSQNAAANLDAIDRLIGRLERTLGDDVDRPAVMTSAPICGPRLGR